MTADSRKIQDELSMLLAWEAGEISEGVMVKVTGLDRVSLRERRLMLVGHGLTLAHKLRSGRAPSCPQAPGVECDYPDCTSVGCPVNPRLGKTREAEFYRNQLEMIASDSRRTRARCLAESALTFWDSLMEERDRQAAMEDSPEANTHA